MLSMPLLMMACTLNVQASETSSSQEIGVYMSCPATQIDEMTPTEKPEPESVPEENVSDNVQTGDSINFLVYGSLCGVSMLSMLAVVKIQKGGVRDED